MLSFSCSSCQKKLTIKEEHAGKKIKCPSCGQVAVAPGPTEAPAQPVPLPIAPVAAPAYAPPAPLAAPFMPALPNDQETTTDAKPAETKAREAKIRDHDPILTNFLAPAQADDELGRLGKYRILSIIGHGGMGIVYKAEDSVLKRLVALKAILPSLGASANVRKRFLREARSMAAVEHDHIVRLYEVNEDRGVPYIAMEFLAGEPLDRRLANEGPLPLAEVLRIGRETAEGLAAAHGRGLIHRDIKPANLWLEAPRARVKILDFGLARADQEESRITQSGAVLGTPAYMSPEQGRGETVDFRCDLFSLGVVLYRLSTGAEPFTAQDALSTIMAIATETPTPPQLQNFDVPVELSDLIMNLLEKDPTQRTGSAQEVVEALSRIERGEAAPAPAKNDTPSPAVSSVTASKRKDNKRLYWMIIAAAVVAVFGCLALTLLLGGLYLFV